MALTSYRSRTTSPGPRSSLRRGGYPDGFEMEAFLATAGDLVTQAAVTMWEDLGIRSTLTRLPYSALRPQHVRRTIKGVWGSSGAPSSVEPLERYGILQNAAPTPSTLAGNIPSGRRCRTRPSLWWILRSAGPRWLRMARWEFDHVMRIPTYSLSRGGVRPPWPHCLADRAQARPVGTDGRDQSPAQQLGVCAPPEMKPLGQLKRKV